MQKWLSRWTAEKRGGWSMCLRDAALVPLGIGHPRPRVSVLLHVIDPSGANLDASGDLGFGIGRSEIEVHPVLGSPRLGHLGEDPGRLLLSLHWCPATLVPASGKADGSEVAGRLRV